MKHILTVFLLTALLPAREIYKQVRIYSDTQQTLSKLQNSGLDIDHTYREPGQWIEFALIDTMGNHGTRSFTVHEGSLTPF